MPNHPFGAEEIKRLAALTPRDVEGRDLPSDVAVQAFSFAFRNLRPLLRIGLPLMAAVVAVEYYIMTKQSPWTVVTLFMKMGVYVLATTVYAVAIHRWILLRSVPRGGFYFRLERDEIVFAAASLIFVLAYEALLFSIGNSRFFGSLSNILLLAAFLGLALMVWLLGRLCLVFPHAAVTGRLDPALSWHAMRHRFWDWFSIFAKIFIILVIVQFAVATLFVMPFLATKTIAPDLLLLLYLPISVLLIGFSEAVTVAALSFVYRDITRSPEPEQPPVPKQPAPPVEADASNWTG